MALVFLIKLTVWSRERERVGKEGKEGKKERRGERKRERERERA